MSSTRRRCQILWDDDSDCDGAGNGEYPSALLEAVEKEDWDSPTKVRRTVVKTPKPRRDIGSRKKRRVDNMEEDTVLWDGQPSPWGDYAVSGDSEMDHTATASGDSEADLDAFVDAINAHVAGFYFLERNLFAVQGWDCVRRQSTVLDGDLLLACTCPRSLDPTCIHRQFFRYFEIEALSEMQQDRNTDSPAILFLRQVLQNEEVYSLFSVKSTSSSALKGRAIVRHTGVAGSWRGDWKCSKDHGGSSCVHIRRVQELVGHPEEQDRDHGVREGGSTVTDMVITRSGSVSYLGIQVPAWASLPSDPHLYAVPAPFRSPPSVPLPLNETSSCPCPSGRTFYDPSRPTTERLCKIYTISQVYEHHIMLQRCPTCPPTSRRFIGPDLREMGLFNYNNTVLVSHELMEEYTSAYTLSETPFSAWVQHLARRYAAFNQAFMGEDLFRSVWFAYVELQNFDNDMTCGKCGEFPDTVIWDGITLAFGRKHVRSSLRPPTTPSQDSLVREKMKYHKKQQLIEDKNLRKRLRLVLDPPDLDGLSDWEAEDALPTPSSSPLKGSGARAREVKLIREHLGRLEAVEEGLRKTCPAVADIFASVYGPCSFAEGEKPDLAYKSFFRQVSAGVIRGEFVG
ncbi:hypothetical protein CC2G_006445 [Coprinopsis cinerea AmutBmut pab1-1]|nr:hypothetical protein CC2G_006445 [Coprinopsis cinerea AmutBmut pab1-1]